MPKAPTRPPAAAAAAATQACRNRSGSSTTWSAASARISASGLARPTKAVAAAIAAAESRRSGSSRIVALQPTSALCCSAKKAKLGMGDDDGRLEQGRVGDPKERVLKARALAGEGQELLRQGLARDRPQARAVSSREHHRHDPVRQTQPPYGAPGPFIGGAEPASPIRRRASTMRG